MKYEAPTKIVTDLTGLSIHSINHLRKTARERGYNSEKSKIILTEYVTDASHSGCFKIIIPDKKEAVVNRVRKNCYDREMSITELEAEFKLFSTSVL